MAEINIVVALGPPSVNMYYLGVGRQVYHNNLPQSLVERIQDGRMANTRLNYINLDKSGSLWCGEEMVGPTVSYQAATGGLLEQHICTTATGGFVTFPDYDQLESGSQPWYFVAAKHTGSWNASLPDFYLTTIAALKTQIPNFDNALKWIIFGHGGTHIYQFANGFLANLEGDHENPGNILNQALKQFDPEHNKSISQGEWMIDRGSSISLHDTNHFFLKFKNTRTGLYELRFCLPPHLETKLRELLAFSKTAEEQSAISLERQIIVGQVNMNLSAQVSANNAMNMSMMQGGLSFANAASDVKYEYVRKKKWGFF